MPAQLFSPLTSKLFGGASLVILIALALMFAWGQAGWRNAQSYKLALEMQQKAMVAAQAAATAKAVAAKIGAENESAALARKADNAENQVADLRAAAVRFGDARRVWSKGAGCSPSGPAAPSPIGPAPDRDGPGADAVVLTRPEYDQLVTNSLRLEKVRRWGEDNIAAKRAIPEVLFGNGDGAE